ncbi:hypothetical protein [Brevundimonas sp.]|uniref:hypothetical protein n=1 Tax=Brevundimonas sp. TaxID=1871086 RepID=UPI0027380138|nr:hypothetical protein [Brevundimonas sp.]MDP3802079.1 hypothetical protein [Brevundimonas sp.]
MTHRKTHLWVSLIVGVVVWGAYFVHVVQALRRGDTGGLAFWFLGALGLVMALEATATGLIAWLFRRRARALDDGPTLDAALRASHVALMLLIAMILVLAGLLAAPALFGWSLIGTTPDAPVIAANVLLAMVVIAELVRAAFTLALIPRR